MGHPYVEGIALRLIVWFEQDTVVIAVLGMDKARIGNVFYDRVGGRADSIIDLWKLRRAEEGRS